MVTVPRIVTGEPPEWLTAHTVRNMHEIGPSPATRREWHEAGLALPDVDRMRTERLARVDACATRLSLRDRRREVGPTPA